MTFLAAALRSSPADVDELRASLIAAIKSSLERIHGNRVPSDHETAIYSHLDRLAGIVPTAQGLRLLGALLDKVEIGAYATLGQFASDLPAQYVFTDQELTAAGSHELQRLLDDTRPTRQHRRSEFRDLL